MTEKMIINDHVEIPLSPSDLFALITDLDAVVPCVPGAVLNPAEGRDDGVRGGQIVVAFGPIRYRYDGTIRVLATDPGARTVTYAASADETSGEGTLGGELTLKVVAAGSQSALDVSCEAVVTGMVADYGQDMAEEVARDIIRQFANSVRDRYPHSQSATTDRADAAAQPPASAKPIGGLRLLFRVTVQRLFRRLLRRSKSGSDIEG